jgi:multiple sugar transport system substrate-binding protein
MSIQKMNRRQFLKAGAVGTAGLVAAASGLSIASGQPAFRRRKYQASGTISLIDPWAGAPGLNAAQEAQIERFMESHPNITVERSEIPFGDFVQLLVQGAAAGELPDVMLIDNPDFHAFAALGVLEDLTEAVESWGQADMYFPGHWSSTVFNGVNYGVPVFSNCLQLWVNTAMAEEAGVDVPTTFDELREAAAAMTNDDHFGLVVAAIHNEEGTFQWLPFLWSTGSDLATINDEGGQAALALWADLVQEGSMSQGILGWDQGAAKDEFGNLRAAMMINGPWMIPSLTNDFSDVEWQIAAIPRDQDFTSILGGENYGVSLGSPNVEAAWEYIAWTQEPENYKQFLQEAGMFPSREDAAEDPYWADDPVLSVFLEGVKVARPRAYGPEYAQMSNAVQDAMQAAISGESTVEDALNEAAEIITPLLPEEEA